MRGAAWSALAVVALLWPARIIGAFDGVPLDGRAEAIAIGLLVPALWWLDRKAPAALWARVAMVSLLAWKLGTLAVAGQQGLCLASYARAPLDGVNQGIPIKEPAGALRSWDLRAQLWAARPACTAILTRPLPTQDAFPAWFLNVTDQMLGRRDFVMAVRGFVTTSVPRTLTFDLDRDVRLSGRVDQTTFAGEPIRLDPGTHAFDLSMDLSGEAWRFEPKLDGVPLWDAALVTTEMPSGVDRFLASWAWAVSPLLVLAFVAGLVVRLLRQMRPGPYALLWVGGASLVGAMLAVGVDSPWQRAAGVIGLASVAVPLPVRLRNLRGAFLLLGIPWLAFFGAWSIGKVGHFSVYSYDDWLTYQVAGYRIYMHGFWLEGGNAVFDFQPFYRWMTGALHLVFGDSSVGEIYWDATCLLAGALLAFYVVRVAAGFRWGLAAGAATLATLTLGTPWYFMGRGLSEIAAAGWAFLSMFFLLRSRRGHAGWAVAAAIAAVLMFYTRLNHLVFAAFLPAFLLPLRVPARVTAVRAALTRVRLAPAAILIAGFTGGVVLFMARTWYYTGVFSLFYGTSLRHNDTGLRPWTLLDGSVWTRVMHSLAATVFMNEPPRPDARAFFLIAGVVVLVATMLQLPIARKIPAVLVIATIGGGAGAFLAHAHGYPGRFSIHLIPFACALTMTAAAQWRRVIPTRSSPA